MALVQLEFNSKEDFLKVFIIKNIVTNEEFIVRNKTQFCEDKDLTYRLLSYTQTKDRNHHKNFVISDCDISFIESEDGDKTLYGTDIRGYCVKIGESESSTKDETEDDNLSDKAYLEKELRKYLKQNQKLRDNINTIRKINRETFRMETITSDIVEMFKDKLSKGVPKKTSIFRTNNQNKEVAILCLSDLHFGQKVEEVNNYFDEDVADYRLGKIFDKFRKEIDLRGIRDIHIMFLGDLIYSQSIMTKPDMKLSGQYPEVQSTIVAFEIIAKHMDCLVKDCNVYVSGIIGNESRFSNHMMPSSLKNEAKNNMDVIVYNMLKQRYRSLDNVNFVSDGDELEAIVNVEGYNILLTHGNSKAINHKDLEKSLFNVRARYSNSCDIDYCVLGHIHSTQIGDKYARNSSLVGGNSYSNELGIVESSVSQNMIIVSKEDGIKTFALQVK